MENEAQEFQAWLRRVRTLAKGGDQGEREALWRAFNSLALSLAQLAKSDISSIDFDLFQGVLQYCYNMLNRGLSVGNDRALTYSHTLACILCDSIERARQHESGFVAKMEATVSDWPMVRSRGPTIRSAQLAKMIFDKMRFYRLLLRRKKKGIESRDRLTRAAEQHVRTIEGANEFKAVLELPKKLDASSYEAWWKVGKKILKRYWKDSPEEHKKDLAEVARQARASGKTPQTYMIGLVQKSFRTLATRAK
jgi:hypothetical protein